MGILESAARVAVQEGLRLKMDAIDVNEQGVAYSNAPQYITSKHTCVFSGMSKWNCLAPMPRLLQRGVIPDEDERRSNYIPHRERKIFT